MCLERYFLSHAWSIDLCVKIVGAPRIVRADCGTENVVVAGLQRFFRSNAADDFSGDKSFLYGKSSANQVVDFCFFQSFL